MLILNSTQKVQVFLGGVVTTSQCPIIASWSDDDGTTLTSNALTSVTNNTALVDVIAAPAAATVRQLKALSLYNKDTAPVIATIQIDVAGVKTIFFTLTLAVGYWVTIIGDQICTFNASGSLVAGIVGAAGTNGTSGNTVLTTSGTPSNAVGANGDYANDSTAQVMYGPKAAGAWPAGVSYKGATGTAGVVGSQWRTGAGVPSNALGVDGDYYINTTTSDVYQRAAGAYSITFNIKGATGATGSDGNAPLLFNLIYLGLAR